MFRSDQAKLKAGTIGASQRAPTEAGELLFEELVRHGRNGTPGRIEELGRIYQEIIPETEALDRHALWPRLIDLIELNEINPNPLLAMAVCDPEERIAATCALDFVCYSPLDNDGRPMGVVEFVNCFSKPGTLANPGAVFGGLLALGDDNLEQFYRQTTPLLTPDQLKVAALASRSGRLFHATIDYIIWLLEGLAGDTRAGAEDLFGAIAAALCNHFNNAQQSHAALATRSYPCTQHLAPIKIHQAWALPDYAALIAPRLHAIADCEGQPQIMPEVLRYLGITRN